MSSGGGLGKRALKSWRGQDWLDLPLTPILALWWIWDLGVHDYFLGKCSLIVGDDQFWGISAHFLGGTLPSFGLSDA